MTYLHLYLAALYDALEKGGKQEDIDRAISEINAPTQTAFEAWLKATGALPCAVCGVPFTPTTPDLNAEALCPTCPSNTKTNPS